MINEGNLRIQLKKIYNFHIARFNVPFSSLRVKCEHTQQVCDVEKCDFSHGVDTFLMLLRRMCLSKCPREKIMK